MKIVGLLLSLLLLAGSTLSTAGRSSVPVVQVGGLTLSEDGVEFIVREETGGRAYYEKALCRPSWPGGASGVTWGVGYDGGYNSRAGIERDWSPVTSSGEIGALKSVAGKKGSRAKYEARRIRSVVHVNWQEASETFTRSTLPRFADLTRRTFPGMEKLPPDAQAVLVSIVFNRGSSMRGSTRREMRGIRDAVSAQDYQKVPGLILAMKRLWVGKGLDGLLRRREREAARFKVAIQ